MQGLGVLQYGLQGALGQQGSAISSAQLSVLTEALQQAQKQTSAQASEALGLVGASLEQQKALGQAKLATELTAPQFTSKAAESALSGENALAQLLGQTNVGLKSATRIHQGRCSGGSSQGARRRFSHTSFGRRSISSWSPKT
jgi:hypothetical protein